MPDIVRILQPGWLLLISFRSQYFDALCLAHGRLWHNMDMLFEKRIGRIFDSPEEYSWQTSSEIRSSLTCDYGLELLELFGIGVCSGIPGDPYDYIVMPPQLDSAEQNILMKLELELGHYLPDAGRYILTVARKPKDYVH